MLTTNQFICILSCFWTDVVNKSPRNKKNNVFPNCRLYDLDFQFIHRKPEVLSSNVVSALI